MDKEQAIEKLNDIRCHVKETSAEEQALVMAIDALKQPVATDANVGDTISRQEALEKVRAMQTYKLFMGDDMILVDKAEVQTELMMLPSAQPEPKEGHWIDKGWNGDWAWQIDGRGNCWRVIECSECGKGVSVESNYCPHCGADMKGEQDG